MKKSNSSPLKWLTIIFSLTLLLSSSLKVASVWNNNFAFTADQGRDLVDVRHMVVNISPRLVGPTTSINGVLLGPFYYYFISVPFILFGGNPTAIVYWQIFWFQLATVFLWFVLKKKNQTLANISGILVLLSPIGFYTARYFWNANAMPIFSLIYIALLLQSLWSPKYFWTVLLGLVCGFSLQIEAAFGILFFPFALIYILVCHSGLEKFIPSISVGESIKIKFQKVIYLSLAFFATLLPQALFELRHNFNMTKTLIAGLSGSSTVLGEKLTLLERLVQRQEIYLSAVRETSHIPLESITWVYLAGLLVTFYFLFRKWFSKVTIQVISLSLGFSVFSFVLYLFFSQNLKHWYTLGLPMFFLIFLSVILSEAIGKNKLGIIMVTTFFILSFYHTSLYHSQYIAKIFSVPSDDPSNLANQLKAIDYIYGQANGKSFKSYIYLPSVYDYTYQYLFWWYGKKKYGYMPADLAYLPNQPEYIEDMKSFHVPQKPQTPTDPIFLIVEKGTDLTRYQEWSKNFMGLKASTPYSLGPKLEVYTLRTAQAIQDSRLIKEITNPK